MSHYHLHSNNDSHSHDDDHSYNHQFSNHLNFYNHREHNTKIFKIIMSLTTIFALFEFLGGYLSHSLALISDSFHMITDSSTILLSLIMSHISNKPADNDHSYGHGRADILGAFINSIFMLFVIAFLVYESILKFIHPTEIHSIPIIVIASIGLIVNFIGFKFLEKQQHTLNSKAALLHIIGDLLSSLSTIIVGIIMYFTHCVILDAILSLLIAFILIPSTINIIKQSTHILMEGVPFNLDYEEVGNSISSVNNVLSIHDLHIWIMNSDSISLSAHIVISETSNWNTILNNIQEMLCVKYNIHHVTLQPEILN